MAALALNSARTAPSFFTSLFAASAASSWSLLGGLPFRWSASPLESLMELFPPFLLAVPKKKTSHSRKSMRSANKGLKDKHSTRHSTYSNSLTQFLVRSCPLSGMWRTKTRASFMSKLLFHLEPRLEVSGEGREWYLRGEYCGTPVKDTFIRDIMHNNLHPVVTKSTHRAEQVKQHVISLQSSPELPSST